jgi:hypothetical protein
MSLNNIQLNAQMLAGLYADSLIETVTTSVPEKNSIRFLGSNQKQITVIVNHASVPFLPDRELSFLSSILNACKLSLADIALVNYREGENRSLPQLEESLQPKYILLFGVEPAAMDLPINFPQFQLQPFNKRTYLYAPALNELEQHKALKKKLWNCLKIAFDL